mmetsp:Transcript_5834/g.12788  ORF Transcript_5834/g.12788 Transcript_5834/m.12788 type:complete len:465 (-) Transcript_5834:368-1762(-)
MRPGICNVLVAEPRALAGIDKNMRRVASVPVHIQINPRQCQIRLGQNIEQSPVTPRPIVERRLQRTLLGTHPLVRHGLQVRIPALRGRGTDAGGMRLLHDRRRRAGGCRVAQPLVHVIQKGSRELAGGEVDVVPVPLEGILSPAPPDADVEYAVALVDVPLGEGGVAIPQIRLVLDGDVEADGLAGGHDHVLDPGIVGEGAPLEHALPLHGALGDELPIFRDEGLPRGEGVGRVLAAVDAGVGKGAVVVGAPGPSNVDGEGGIDEAANVQFHAVNLHVLEPFGEILGRGSIGVGIDVGRDVEHHAVAPHGVQPSRAELPVAPRHSVRGVAGEEAVGELLVIFLEGGDARIEQIVVEGAVEDGGFFHLEVGRIVVDEVALHDGISRVQIDGGVVRVQRDLLVVAGPSVGDLFARDEFCGGCCVPVGREEGERGHRRTPRARASLVVLLHGRRDHHVQAQRFVRGD